MKGGKVIYRSVKMDDNTNRAALSVMDQIKLVFSSFSNTDSELDISSKMSTDRLKKVAALSTFFEKSIARAKELHESSVTMKLSSEFIPYLDEVINKETGLGRFYDIEVIKRDLPITVKHYFIVRVHLRKGDGK